MAPLRYLIRLDDACPCMHHERWKEIEMVLDRHQIHPIVAVIPDNADVSLKFDSHNPSFWEIARSWQQKDWTIALHGYQHILEPTETYGFVPFHKYSEFVGVPLNEQKKKISDGNNVLLGHGITPEVWIAPAHSFDENTLIALRDCTNINVISDGLALDVYFDRGFYWIPQQIGVFRRMLFGLWTLCLHPSTMSYEDIDQLDKQISKNRHLFINYSPGVLKERKRSFVDYLFSLAHGILRKSKQNFGSYT
jgi:hypothetical protein